MTLIKSMSLLALLPVLFIAGCTSSGTMQINQDISSLDSVALVVTVGAGNVIIDSYNLSGAIVGELKYTGEQPVAFFEPQEKRMTVNVPSGNGNILLPRGTETSLNVDMAAGNAEIDLRDLKVQSMDVTGVASNVLVVFSGSVATQAGINAGAGTVSLYFPSDVGYKITFANEVPPDLAVGFDEVKTEGGFMSKNYETAAVKNDITLTLTTGVINTYTFSPDSGAP